MVWLETLKVLGVVTNESVYPVSCEFFYLLVGKDVDAVGRSK